MHRTQVDIRTDQYEMLNARARREGRSLASIIREILDAHLSGGKPAHDPFDRVIGLAKGDGSAVAENHAEYLYGKRR